MCMLEEHVSDEDCVRWIRQQAALLTSCSFCLLVSDEWAESSTPEPTGCPADPGSQSASNHHADKEPEEVWHRGRQGILGAPSS